MHLLSRRFARAPRIVNLPFDDKPQLPTELLLLILSYVRERMDLVILCRVSKIFWDICRPLLYAVVSIKPNRDTRTAHLHLYGAIRKASFSRTITEFSITLVNTALCSRWEPGRPFTYSNQCTCYKDHQEMENAVQSLHGLHSFTIVCQLCSESHHRQHLLKVDPPMLRKFMFDCRESTRYHDPKTIGPRSILRAPFMSKITALALQTEETRRYYPEEHHAIYAGIMRDTSVLSHLTTLGHDGTDFCDFILSQRPVQRLCLYGINWNYTLNEAIRNTPGTLSHLFSYALLYYLPIYMKKGIEPYRHLRYIGVITGIESQEEDAFREMEVLTPLSKLEFMEINRYRVSPPYWRPTTSIYGFTPSEHFLELLGHRHRLLRRVLLIGRESPHQDPRFNGCSYGGSRGILWENRSSEGILWEQKGGAWESRPVPTLEFWDIVCDKLDEI